MQAKSTELHCNGDPGECSYNGGCMYACGAMQASAPAPLEAVARAGIPIESDLRFVFGELKMAKIQGARSDSNKLLDSALARIERMIAEATGTKPAPTEPTKQACGHPRWLALQSVESDTVLCELCEMRQQRDDAVLMEQEHAETIRQLTRALREATEAPTFMDEPAPAATQQVELSDAQIAAALSTWFSDDYVGHASRMRAAILAARGKP